MTQAKLNALAAAATHYATLCDKRGKPTDIAELDFYEALLPLLRGFEAYTEIEEHKDDLERNIAPFNTVELAEYLGDQRATEARA
jgi:hypothetical protein